MTNDPFEQLRNEIITLKKKTGETFSDIQAKMENGNKIINFAARGLQVDDGDTIIRHLPDNRTEEYQVLDSNFVSGYHGILAQYKCKVQKTTALRPSSNQGNRVIYNVNNYGANSRFNLHSHDESTNVTDVNASQFFKELRETVERDVDDETKQQEILKQVSELEKNLNTPQFLNAYQRFIDLAANHMTIFAPFIPALSQMLSG